MTFDRTALFLLLMVSGWIALVTGQPRFMTECLRAGGNMRGAIRTFPALSGSNIVDSVASYISHECEPLEAFRPQRMRLNSCVDWPRSCYSQLQQL